MAQKIKWTIILLVIVLIIGTISLNFTSGAKGKKGNRRKVEKNEIKGPNPGKEPEPEKGPEVENPDMEKEDVHCPEKRMAASTAGDEDGKKLMAIFKEYLVTMRAGEVPSALEQSVRINSALWYLKDKVEQMMRIMGREMAEIDGGEPSEEVQEFQKEWANIAKIGHEGKTKLTLCERYKVAAELLKMLVHYAESRPKIQNFVMNEDLMEIIRVDQVDCFSPEDRDRIYNYLINTKIILTIHGQNVRTLLGGDQQFRHFFCYEVDIKRTKVALNILTSSYFLSKMEDQFPEVLRIDMPLNSTIYTRFERLLLNHSESKPYRMTFHSLTVALLLRKLISPTSTPFWATLPLGASTISALWQKVNSLAKSSRRDLLSGIHLCSLIKLLTFLLNFNSKNSYKLTEKVAKRWNAEECAGGEEQKKAREELIKGPGGVILLEGATEAFRFEAPSLRNMLRVPGAKSRLAKLMGTGERMELVIKHNGLEEVIGDYGFDKNVFLWAKYKIVLFAACNDRDLKTSKLGADLIIFIRWFHRELDKSDSLRSANDQIRDYVGEMIYDPIFDLGEVELMEEEKVLEGIFIETKTFVENLKGAGGERVFTKWRELVEKIRERKWSEGKNDQKLKEEARRWIRELHRPELIAMIRKGEMVAELMAVAKKNDLIFQVPKNLELFVNENAVEGILRELFPFGNESGGFVEKIIKSEIEKDEKEKRKQALPERNEMKEKLKREWKEREQREAEELGEAAYTHFECPSKKVSMEELKAYDQANITDRFALSGIRTLMDYLEEYEEVEEVDEFAPGRVRRRTRLELRVELNAILWNSLSLARNMVELARRIEPAPSARFGQERDQIGRDFGELLEGVAEPRMALFLVISFVGFLKQNKVLWEESAQWRGQLLHEGVVTETNGKMNLLKDSNYEFGAASVFRQFNNDIREDGKWTKPEYDEALLQQFHAALSRAGKIEYFNFFYLSEIMGESREIQGYFCKMKEPKNMGKAKMKLERLVGEEYMIELHEMFPEILQFDCILPITQVPLYKQFLRHKSGTEQAYLWEARLVLPVLMKRLRERILNVVPGAMSGLVSKAFRTRWKLLIRFQVYPHLRRALVGPAPGHPEFVPHSLPFSLCLVQRFTHYAEKAMELYGKARAEIRAEAVERWDYERCGSEPEQWRAHREQRQELGELHYVELKYFLGIENHIGQNLQKFIMETQGARTRIRKLLDNEKRYDELAEQYKAQWRDTRLFDDSRLMGAYLDSLFDLDKATRVVGTLSVFCAVWVRWMEQQLQLENPMHLKGAEMRMEAQARLYFEDLYDALGDFETFHELEQKSYLLRELLKLIREFVDINGRGAELMNMGRKTTGRGDTVRKGEDTVVPRLVDWMRWKKLLTKWDQIVAEAEERAKEKRLIEEEQDYVQWIDGIHWDTLIRLIGNSEEFREKLKNGFEAEDGERAKARLQDFISWEMVEKLMELLKMGENRGEFEQKLAEMKGWRPKSEKDGEKEREVERKKAEEDKADWMMAEMIREEEQIGELKRKLAEMQAEKRKRRAEQRKREREEKRRIREEEGREAEKDEGEIELIREEEEKDQREDVIEGSEIGNDQKQIDELGMELPIMTKKKKRNRQNDGAKEKGTKERPKKGDKEKSEMAETMTIFWQKDVKLISFISDQNLQSNYWEFLNDPSEGRRWMLDLGTYINEIWQRWQMIKINGNGLEYIVGGKFGEEGPSLKDDIDTRRAELEGILMNKTVNSWEEYEELQRKLHGILKRMIRGKAVNGKDEEELEIIGVRSQLHRNKLAKTIIDREMVGENIWPKIGKRGQNKVLAILFDRREAKKTNLASRFEEYLEAWRNLKRQQLIDGTLHQYYAKPIKYLSNDWLIKFPENSQQIFIQDLENNKMEKNLLSQVLIRSESVESKSNLAEDALTKIRAIISKWSKGLARLVVTGSYLLGAHTSGTDVDTICIVPERMSPREEKRKFYGANECHLAERFCNDNSLFCRFCKNANVTMLHKIPFAYIPLIELNFGGVDFDIAFVSIPDIDYLPDEPLEPADIEWMMQVLAVQWQPPESMLKSLSGYLANNQIVELLKEKNMPKFRHFLLILKHWAKSNHIYGGVFGFFNGISLSILATKCILWYPNATLPFLLQKMMFLLSNWSWPIPVQLIDKPGPFFVRFSWHPFVPGPFSPMPIITPSILTQNASLNINWSTAKIIRRAMQNAFSQLKHIENMMSPGDANQWQKLFPANNFTEKFHHFVVISCVVSALPHIEQFCGFVQRKIRGHLQQIDLKLANFIEYGHINPKMNLAKNNECPKRFWDKAFRNPLCKIWLVGLKIKDELDEKKLVPEFGQNVNQIFQNEFDAKIYKEYDIKVMRGWYQLIKLESNYATSEDLAGWINGSENAGR